MDFLLRNKSGKVINKIHGDESFVERYCKRHGYTYEKIIDASTLNAEKSELNTVQSKLREEAYNAQNIIKWNGEMLTVTQAANLWQYYSAEGNTEKASKLTELIAEAKASIRDQYPDEEVSV